MRNQFMEGIFFNPNATPEIESVVVARGPLEPEKS
jgi:hypothetical protein